MTINYCYIIEFMNNYMKKLTMKIPEYMKILTITIIFLVYVV